MKTSLFLHFGSLAAWVLLTILPTTGARAQAFGDNFNDGDDVGWTHFVPVAGATYTFPASSQGGLGYQLTSPPGSPAGRVASIMTSGYSLGDFIISVDLVNWNNALRQEMGVMGRVQASPAGLLPTGYSMIYVNRFSAGAGGTDQIRIYRDGAGEHSLLTGSQGQFAQNPPGGTPPPNPALADYRLVFGSLGSTLWGQVIDLNTGFPMMFSTGSGPATNTIWAVDATYSSGLAGVVSVAGTAGNPSVNPTFDNFSVVPEPSTVALIGLGLTGVLLLRRQSWKRA